MAHKENFGVDQSTVRVVLVVLSVYLFVTFRGTDSGSLSVVLLVVTSINMLVLTLRDISYDHTHSAPVEWTTVRPDSLNSDEYERAVRWTVVVRAVQVVSGVAVAVTILSGGLGQLGMLVVVGGLPATVVGGVKHYQKGTKPWHPIVPSDGTRPDS